MTGLGTSERSWSARPPASTRCGFAVLLMPVFLALPLAVSLPAVADGAGVDPDAGRLLKRMTDFVGSEETFSLETVNTVEVVLENGQKVQFTGGASTTVQRPDRLYSERTSDIMRQVLYYDGESVTLVNPGDGVYATVPAPATLDGMLDFAREVLDIVAPAGDLITRDAYERLMSDTRSGFVVGKSYIAGVRCDHLAFRGYDVDWQVWIEDGDRPVPRKFVITTLDVEQAPQAEVLVTRWTSSPSIKKAQFEFTPPAGMLRVEFVPPDSQGEQP